MLQISSYFGQKENAHLSLPQSASLTAPSAEGAKGLFLHAERLSYDRRFFAREALIKSARAGSERFFHSRKFQKRRNTVCISRFWN